MDASVPSAQRESADGALVLATGAADLKNKQGLNPGEISTTGNLTVSQPTLGGSTGDKPGVELTRSELLNAIDFEIVQRESAINRHGITSWGVVAATIALGWASLNEALQPSHIWTNVILVLFVAKWALGLITSPWATAFGFAPSAGLVPSRRHLPRLALSKFGLNPDLLRYAALDMLFTLAVGIYLGCRGYWLLSVVASAFAILAVLLLAFIMALCYIKIPLLKLGPGPINQPRSLTSTLVVFSASGLVLFAGVRSLASTWSTLNTGDIRLGLLLAALLMVFYWSLWLIQPPVGVAALRSLRTRLAFGLIGPADARGEAESLLLGPPEHNYVTTKAEAVNAELDAYITLCNADTAAVKRFGAMSDKLRASPGDHKLLHDITSEFRPFVKRAIANMKALDTHMETVVKLRCQLHVRVEAAKRLLTIPPDQLDALVSGVDTRIRQAGTARGVLQNTLTDFKPALDFLFDAQRGVKLPKELTRTDMFAALFRD